MGESSSSMVDLAGLSPDLAAAVRLVIDGLGAEVADPGGFDRWAPLGRRAADRDRLGEVVQAAERVKAAAEATGLAAIAALTADVMADHGVSADDPRRATKLRAHHRAAGLAVVQEVQLLTGASMPAARQRVRIATAMPDRVGGSRARLAAGEVSWDRVRVCFDETAHLDTTLAGAVMDRVLAPVSRPVGSDGARIALSHSGFRARLRRQLALAEPLRQQADRLHDDAVASRDMSCVPSRCGTAAIQIDGDGVRVFAAQQRVTTLARAARAAGDARTLAQLRSDIATDLLIHGTVPGDPVLAKAPAGKLHVLVELATILPGAADRPGTPQVAEVPGLGFLTGDQVRQIAFRAGSTWTRLVTDPRSGVVYDVSRSYRVPAQMARLVRARDHTCRAPGDCAHPAGECDLDHDAAFDQHSGAQQTRPDNLHALHRGHHNVKTSRLWSSVQHADGTVSWATLTRQVTTTPHDYRDPTGRAGPDRSIAEGAVSAWVARYVEEEFLPSALRDLAGHQLTELDDLPARDGPAPPDTSPGPDGRPGHATIQIVRPKHPVMFEFRGPPPF